MRVSVQQTANRIEAHGSEEVISFDFINITLPPLRDYTFAAWLFLPWAMVKGENIEIDGPVDPIAAENIRRFSSAWELWDPRKYHTVIASGTHEPPPVNKKRREEFVFYSGGLDSTDMLLQLGKRQEKTVALTVQGFDYSPTAEDQFADLRNKVTPLLNHLNYEHVFVRVSKICGALHSWALQLAGVGFLFSETFERGIFAADYNWEQDMLAFPWGLNHVTNRYMTGRDFGIYPQCEDSTRTMKAENVARDPLGLQAASFCKRRELRPANCGTCSKCIRTKAMFAVTLGKQPDIFLDADFGPDFLDQIDLDDRKEQAFFIDLCQIAIQRGTLQSIEGLAEKYHNFKNPPPPEKIILIYIYHSWSKMVSKRVQMIDPKADPEREPL